MSTKQSRMLALDTFRGMTIMAMVLVNNPGSWSFVYAPLKHAEWHGWTMTDLIFPFFIFIVGISISLSMQNQLARNLPKLGSCFAQHIARNMRKKGYTVVDTEPSPPGLHGIAANKFGYELFSARTGNVYIVRQLLQLFEEAFGMWKPHQVVWKKGDRYFDAMRPFTPIVMNAIWITTMEQKRELLSVE